MAACMAACEMNGEQMAVVSIDVCLEPLLVDPCLSEGTLLAGELILHLLKIRVPIEELVCVDLEDAVNGCHVEV